MISSRMLLGQITSSLRAPAKLSSFHSSNCSLLVGSFRSAPFRISNLEPLLQNTRVGGYLQLQAPAVGSLPKFFIAYHIPASPVFSCNCALFCAMGIRYSLCFQYFPHSFYRHRGWYPPPSLSPRRWAAMNGEVAPLGRTHCDGQLPQSKSWDSLPKRWGRRSHP